jgi:hypothetical protein
LICCFIRPWESWGLLFFGVAAPDVSIDGQPYALRTQEQQVSDLIYEHFKVYTDCE